MDLSSSTCVTVQSLHGFVNSFVRSVCVSMAALSKHLHGFNSFFNQKRHSAFKIELNLK